MAGDWIKWGKGLAKRSEVIQMAGLLKLNRTDVAGRLMEFWEWCDENVPAENVKPDGTAFVKLSPDDDDNRAFFDELTCTSGFAAAISAVHWMYFRGGRIEVPNFDRHNGSTAKTRARTAKNQRTKRARDATLTDDRRPVVTTQRQRLSSRSYDNSMTREEKSRKELQIPPPPQSPPEPTPVPQVSGDGWGEVVEELILVGMGTAGQIAVAAEEAGWTVRKAVAAISHWREHHETQGWEEGILDFRLRSEACARMPVEKGWPDPKGGQSARKTPQAPPGPSKAEIEQRRKRLLQTHGERLTAMTTPERMALLRGQPHTVLRLAQASEPRWRTSEVVADALLAAMEQQGGKGA